MTEKSFKSSEIWTRNKMRLSVENCRRIEPEDINPKYWNSVAVTTGKVEMLQKAYR